MAEIITSDNPPWWMWANVYTEANEMIRRFKKEKFDHTPLDGAWEEFEKIIWDKERSIGKAHQWELGCVALSLCTPNATISWNMIAVHAENMVELLKEREAEEDDNMSSPLKSAEPLSNPTISSTLKEREQTHGDYATFAKTWNDLGKIVFAEWNGSVVENSSMSMILHKIARVLNAPKPHIDNWIDIGGYAKLVVDNTEDELHDFFLDEKVYRALIKIFKTKGSHLGDSEYRGLMSLAHHLSTPLATSSWRLINTYAGNVAKELQDEFNSSPKK